MENLLTQQEIQNVLRSAELNPALRHPSVISFGRERTSLITITPKKGLFLIQGDSDTGFKHIRDRHSYWSGETFWRKGAEESIETPSQFGR